MEVSYLDDPGQVTVNFFDEVISPLKGLIPTEICIARVRFGEGEFWLLQKPLIITSTKLLRLLTIQLYIEFTTHQLIIL